jgi:hypothetical protein
VQRKREGKGEREREVGEMEEKSKEIGGTGVQRRSGGGGGKK